MDFYIMLEKLVKNSAMREDDKQAAREVIRDLKGVNAFGTTVAVTESETKEAPHVHTIETKWSPMNTNKLVDICKECGATVAGPYDPKWERRHW